MAKERQTRDYKMKQAFGQQELKALESQCVQGEAPGCEAACPLHITAKGLLEAAMAGEWAKARSFIDKTTFFPNALAYGCDGPCKGQCKRKTLGGAIELGLVERAAVGLAPYSPPKRLPMAPKAFKAAIFGCGLFEISLACELYRKAYPVDLYTLGLSPLTEVARDANVDTEIAAKDLENALSLGFRIIETSFGHEEAIKKAQAYDFAAFSPSLFYEAAGRHITSDIAYDSDMKLFSAPMGIGAASLIASSKIASNTLGRLSQGAGLYVGREKEGTYETSLYTSLDGIAYESPKPFSVGDLKGWAEGEAKRCIQCECMECVKKCAYLEHFKTYPRPLVREVYNNLSIVMGAHGSNSLINSCALCGQCEAVCPKGLDAGAVCLQAREAMALTGKMPPSAHEFALLDLSHAQSEGYRAALGGENCEWVFFPGCQMGALMPQTMIAAYRGLKEKLGPNGGIILNCCGAIARWAGEQEIFEEAMGLVKEDFKKLGGPKRVITGCPTCSKTLREQYGIEPEFIAQALIGSKSPNGSENPLSAYIHDSCGARGDESLKASVRGLAKEAGIILDEPDSEPGCCGYGGLVRYANGPVADLLTERAAQPAEGKPILTYCANCKDRFLKQGKDSFHILEAIYGKEPKSSFTLGERRRNRIKARKELIKEILGEVIMEEAERPYKTVFTNEALSQMEERMIIDEDVFQVIDQARAGSPTALEKASGLSIARARIGSVTFWVKYRKDPSGSCYTVESCYSHRMAITLG